MLYNIICNQHAIIENNFNIDLSDNAILNVFWHCFASSNFQKTIDKGTIYTWVSYKHIVQQLPILGKRNKEGKFVPISKDLVYRRVKRLVEEGFLLKMPKLTKSDQPYYAPTDKIEALFARYSPIGKKTGIPEKNPTPIGKKSGTLSENFPDNNNTIDNEINNNINNIVDENTPTTSAATVPYLSEFIELLKYFISKSGKTRTKVPRTKSLVKRNDKYKMFLARVKEKYTLDEMKMVIDFKVQEWTGTKMDKYIQWQTFFNSKNLPKYIDQALNAKIKPVASEKSASSISSPKKEESLLEDELRNYNTIFKRINNSIFTKSVFKSVFGGQNWNRYRTRLTELEIIKLVEKAIVQKTKAFNQNTPLQDIIKDVLK